jgi:hypothetical protein
MCILVIVARGFMCTSAKVRWLMLNTLDHVGCMTSMRRVHNRVYFELTGTGILVVSCRAKKIQMLTRKTAS